MNTWEWLVILTMYLYAFQWVRHVQRDVKKDLNAVLQALEDARKELKTALERSGH